MALHVIKPGAFGFNTAHPMVDTICADMREADITEWNAGINLVRWPGDICSLLHFTLEHFPQATWCAVDETDHCICMWGVTPTGAAGIGQAWLLATNAAERRVHDLHRHFRRGLAEMLAVYPRLHAWAHVGNELHHRWMKHFGFTEHPYQVDQFRLFTIKRD